MDLIEIITLLIIAWSVLSGFLKRNAPAGQTPVPDMGDGDDEGTETATPPGAGRQGRRGGAAESPRAPVATESGSTGQGRTSRRVEDIFDLEALLKDTLFPSQAPTPDSAPSRDTARTSQPVEPAQSRGVGTGENRSAMESSKGAVRERLLRTDENRSRMGRGEERLMRTLENRSLMGTGSGMRSAPGAPRPVTTSAQTADAEGDESTPIQTRESERASQLRRKLSSDSLKDAILISEILQGPRGSVGSGQRRAGSPLGRFGAGSTRSISGAGRQGTGGVKPPRQS